MSWAMFCLAQYVHGWLAGWPAIFLELIYILVIAVCPLATVFDAPGSSELQHQMIILCLRQLNCSSLSESD